MSDHRPAVIIGGGPAGLTAAVELLRRGIRPLVLEQGDRVGGIARTETYKGYRFDIGGHRFYTRVDEVQRLWEEMLGGDLLRVPRLSRIYYHGRFFDYPLELRNALGNLGAGESLLILLSYLKAQLLRRNGEKTFEQWVTNRFGQRLYRTFFKTYTEKVWGIPCDHIQAEWAAQRIRGVSLRSAITQALGATSHAKSLIKEFRYPVLGPGMMWQRFEEWVEKHGGHVSLGTTVEKVRRDGSRVVSVSSRCGNKVESITTDHVISSMPLSNLLGCLTPAPPDHVMEAASGLKYRAFLIVALIIDRKDVFPDNWIYVHSPDVRVGRIQNFKNWSPAMVPEPDRTSLGMEYFCSEEDDTWNKPDQELVNLARKEIAQLGLAREEEVVDGMVVRQPKAYPVYDREYRGHLRIIRDYLESFRNLQTVGRNGMHRYNNQDHSMLTGLLAARNLSGAAADIWDVNTERSYYEDVVTPSDTQAG